MFLLCPKKGLLQEQNLDRCKATSDADPIPKALAIKKVVFWYVDLANNNEDAPEGQKIQVQVASTLEEKWRQKHDFALGTQKRVGGVLMKKLYGLINSDPPAWEVFPL